MAKQQQWTGQQAVPVVAEPPTRGQRFRRWLRQTIYRYRWHLRPAQVALGAWPFALFGWVTVWLEQAQYVWYTTGAVALVALIAGLWFVKGARDRMYLAGATVAAIAWTTTASFWIFVSFDVFCAMVYAWVVLLAVGWGGWLWDHRIRSRIRLQRHADEFPETLEIAGHGRVILLSVDEDWDQEKKCAKVIRYRLKTPRGVDRATITAKQIEISLPQARPGSVTLILDPDDSHLFTAQWVQADPWKATGGADKPITHPILAASREIAKALRAAELHQLNGAPISDAFRAAIPAELRRYVPAGCSVSAGIPLGDRDDGTPIVYVMWDREHGAHNLFIAGMKGSGKTNFLNVLLAGLAPCYDAIIWATDIAKAGQALVHWGEIIDWVATTPEAATFMLRAAAALVTDRGARAARDRRMTDKHIASRRQPIVIVLIEEGRSLLGADHDWARPATKASTDLVTTGRGEGVGEVFVTQYPTGPSMGNSETMRAQMDDRVAFRQAKKGYGQYILNAWDQLDTSALNRDGMFYMENGATSTDARLCRAYKLCDPAEIGKLRELYGPHRPQLTGEDLAVVERVAGHFYRRRRDWLHPRGTVPTQRTTPLFTNPTGDAMPSTGDPSRPSLLDTDPQVRDAAERHAATLDAAKAAVEEDRLLPVAPPMSFDKLVTDTPTPGEKVDLADSVTVRIWRVLLEHVDGIPSGDLAELANTSQSTVSRRMTAMRDAGMARLEGAGRSARWFANAEHPLAARELASTG